MNKYVICSCECTGVLCVHVVNFFPFSHRPSEESIQLIEMKAEYQSES